MIAIIKPLQIDTWRILKVGIDISMLCSSSLDCKGSSFIAPFKRMGSIGLF